MVYKIDENICVGCGACAANCVVSAIERKEDKYTINKNMCKSCKTCESICPVNAISEN
jgi:energy-converting hydrogenase A subunit Q